MTRPIPQQFDDALLKGSDEERLAHFSKKIVAHTHLSDAANLAKDNIEFAPAGEVVAVIGPTEVGTTVLGRSLWKYYQSYWPTLQETGPAESMMHSIGIQAPSSSGRIDERYWKRLLRLLLTKGGDILIDKKLYVPPSEFQLQHSIPPNLLGLPIVPHLPKLNAVFDRNSKRSMRKPLPHIRMKRVYGGKTLEVALK